VRPAVGSPTTGGADGPAPEVTGEDRPVCQREAGDDRADAGRVAGEVRIGGRAVTSLDGRLAVPPEEEDGIVEA